MKLSLNRTVFTEASTTGILYIDDVKECFTIEDKVREVEGKKVSEWKIDKKTAIPKGTYKVIIDMSPKYGKEMLHILDVPGYSGIRIHSGNVAEDTEGCIIVGKTVGKDRVNSSVDAMKGLFPKIKQALDNKEEVTITIK